MAYSKTKITEVLSEVEASTSYIKTTVEELTDEIIRLQDLLDDINTRAHKPLRLGGCDVDDLLDLESACEDIIDLTQQV